MYEILEPEFNVKYLKGLWWRVGKDLKFSETNILKSYFQIFLNSEKKTDKVVYQIMPFVLQECCVEKLEYI